MYYKFLCIQVKAEFYFNFFLPPFVKKNHLPLKAGANVRCVFLDTSTLLFFFLFFS